MPLGGTVHGSLALQAPDIVRWAETSWRVAKVLASFTGNKTVVFNP